MRTLAIDLGTRRIGLAMSDEGGRFATPHDVLWVNAPEQAVPPILQIISREGVERIVIGLPLNMDDTLGPAARKTIAWAHALAEQIPKPILFVDERLSSFAAEQHLIERKRSGEKLTRRRKKQQLDALAAAGFLQAFLDGKLEPIQAAPTTARHHFPAPKGAPPAFPHVKLTRRKTPVSGGSLLRMRWKDSGGNIYEWDSRHGKIEMYNNRGRHLGEFDASDGRQLHGADPSRSIEP